MTGIVGKKLGMTQVYRPDGTAVPVTVIQAEPGTVLKVKTRQSDGYEAVQVGFFEHNKPKRVTKAMAGVFEKAGQKPFRKLREFPMGELAVGDQITVEKFASGDRVSVSAVSKGKGFQGAMKRHGFSGGPASHGSMFKRALGSIGASSYPSRVWKNQRMAGQMGAKRVTVKNLHVEDVRVEQGLLLIRGAVPGARNTVVEVCKED